VSTAERAPGPRSSSARGPGPEDEGWASRQVAALAAAWGRGERITAAEVLGRHPGIDDEAAIRLIYEEASLRRESGLGGDTSEVVRRYPRWAGELRELFDCDRLLRPPRAPAAFPGAGEALGPFLLLAELGRGAAGRTFLATDPTLADRPVVVKVIPDDHDEHLALARLRHTHIVPLFSEHSFPERGLRGLCMPDLGGASLDRILEDLEGIPPGQRTGKHLVGAIDRAARARPHPPTADGPFRRSLEQATFPQAMTWIAACLADALHYAHARGLVHMDLKPSNVLIAADGQPMLLDFHLARAPISRGEWVGGRLGGTSGWMSPEQEAAIEAVVAGNPVPAAVDGRTDIYALGLLLREALGLSPGAGRRPAGVSVGLGDIARKCLSPAPGHRYADPALLAEDLRRELNDLPLVGVRNRTPLERLRKWRRRHPGSLAWGIAGAAALLCAAIALTAYSGLAGRVRGSLEEARRYRSAGKYDEAIRALGRGLSEAGMLPDIGDLRAALQRELALSERGRMAGELHEVADRIRFRYGIDLPTGEDATSLAGACSAIWGRKGRLLAADDGTALDPESERRIKGDLLEIAAVWVDLRIRLAGPGGAEGARAEALGRLDEAESACGESFAIDIRREQLAAPGPAGARRPQSAWEHYDLGRYHLRSGQIEAASAEFRQALDARPQDFWPNFYEGLCAFQLGRLDEAAAGFRACIALAPGVAACYYNRALVEERLGQVAEARRDYTRAIDLDPEFGPALLNRGVLSYKEGRLFDAVRDFEQALRRPADRGTSGRLRYNLALARFARGERELALENIEEAAQLGVREAGRLRDEWR
jgi:serine/threonine protein kinase/Flp pilus assembly protein TadD